MVWGSAKIPRTPKGGQRKCLFQVLLYDRTQRRS